MPHQIAIVGLGAITQKSHLPSIAANPAFRLVAAASLAGEAPGVTVYRDHMAMLAAHPEIEAVIINTPPAARLAIAADVIAAGKHVMLEKPPAATLGGAEHLVRLAAAAGVVLHTAWHSQYNIAVDRAAELLAGKRIASLHVDWKEDVHKYHPGQKWIWGAGGFGVFDMAINGLSIMSRIFDPVPYVTSAVLRVPADASVPVSADVTFSDGAGAVMTAAFDWGWRGDDKRELTIVTTEGQRLELTHSGGRLVVDGVEVVGATRTEYRDIYADFDRLLTERRSRIDLAPLRLVADALLVGRLDIVAPVMT